MTLLASLPYKQLESTNDIKSFLESSTSITGWKRINKKLFGESTLRTFSSNSKSVTVIVNTQGTFLYDWVIQDLATFAKTIQYLESTYGTFDNQGNIFVDPAAMHIVISGADTGYFQVLNPSAANKFLATDLSKLDFSEEFPRKSGLTMEAESWFELNGFTCEWEAECTPNEEKYFPCGKILWQI
jgi:hypothetical protein